MEHEYHVYVTHRDRYARTVGRTRDPEEAERLREQARARGLVPGYSVRTSITPVEAEESES